MLLNSDELQFYFQYAFEHFWKNWQDSLCSDEVLSASDPILSDPNEGQDPQIADMSNGPQNTRTVHSATWSEKIGGASLFSDTSNRERHALGNGYNSSFAPGQRLCSNIRIVIRSKVRRSVFRETGPMIQGVMIGQWRLSHGRGNGVLRNVITSRNGSIQLCWLVVVLLGFRVLVDQRKAAKRPLGS